MFNLSPSMENRKNFVVILLNLMKKANLSGEMIFDMPIDHKISYPQTSENPPLIICYAPTNLEADDLIIEKIYAKKNPENITVITSDNGLKQRVKETGANISSGKTFLSFLEKKNKKKSFYQKPIFESKSDFERLERIFLQKLEDTNE
jgi:predicted RNA-binding protein with PIN domain